ncbi:unnamed protein product, partial [Staurois parvus]
MAEWEAMGGRTGTQVTLWDQQQRDQAVRGPMADLGPGGTYGRACNLPATYDKMENRRSVRRPQSGTWQSGSNGRPYRDPGHTVGPA